MTLCVECNVEMVPREMVSMGSGYREYERDTTPQLECPSCGRIEDIPGNCGCGAVGTHQHNSRWCCGGIMCCPIANM